MKYKPAKYGSSLWIIVGPKDLEFHQNGTLLTFESEDAAQSYINDMLSEDTVSERRGILETANSCKCKLGLKESTNENIEHKMFSIFTNLNETLGSTLKYWKFNEDCVTAYCKDGSKKNFETNMLSEDTATFEKLKKIGNEIQLFLNLHHISATVYVSEPDCISVDIYDGDWKHEHMLFKQLVREFFETHPEYVVMETDQDIIGTSDSDTYSATYNYYINIENM